MMNTDRFLIEELQKINSELKKHLIEKNGEPLFFDFDEIDLVELLNHVNCEKIFYFKSKYGSFSFLGLGQSHEIKASELEKYVLDNPQHFLIAAFMFEENPMNASFILPEWIFVNEEGKTKLSIHPSNAYQTYSSPNLFFNNNFDLFNYDPEINSWKSYEELPEHDQWEKIIKKANHLFETHELEKIVLSRKKIFEYVEPIGTIAFFKAVFNQNNFAQSTYAIFYQTDFDKAFISLTPEKLFSIRHNQFESISLAASAPRGLTPEEDQLYETQLNTSDKLTREHNFVTKEILKKITPLSKSISTSNLEVMKLTYIQHRSIPIRAVLQPNTSALELVCALHPTPAVGGLPWEKAKIQIAALEPYSRDAYAAPIGVISGNYTELAVGIRSALIEGSKLTLFGGAGIVKGSIAEEEWIETGIKMNPFLKVVNL